MPLLPFSHGDGTPREDAAFVNMVLISALYENDQRPFVDYATRVGGRFVYWSRTPETYEPDTAVIIAGGEALVIMAGSTNNAQFIGHAGGALAPIADLLTPIDPIGTAQCNASFLIGQALVEPNIDAAILPIGLGPVRIAGHSYGGAASHIYARHLVNSTHRPTQTELMTFGQPRTYDGRPARQEPDYYARIINPTNPSTYQYENLFVDPVCTSPPAIIQLARLGFFAKSLQKFVGFFWSHHGQPFLLNPDRYAIPLPLPLYADNLPFVNVLQFAANWGGVEVHYQWVYLARAMSAWQNSGLSSDLNFLVPYANLYLGVTLPPENLSPLLTATVLNEAYFEPTTQPVTDPTRSMWEVVSATGYFVSAPLTTPVGSSDNMSLYRGTMEFDSIQGGFSESVYSKDPNETSTTMMTKMRLALASRCALSVTQINTGCLNPIIPTSIKVEDTLVQRDAVSQRIDYPPATFTGGSDQRQTANQNLDLELCARIKYLGGGQRQTAYVAHHGLPIYAYDGVTPSISPTQYGSAFRRLPQPNGNWINRLGDYVVTLARNGLGFRTIAGAWNDQASGFPLTYATPQTWYYNPTVQMIELQWTTVGTGSNPPFFPAGLIAQQPANWPVVGSFCRLQVRKWKSFAVLAGRWAAQVVTPQTGNAFALRIIRTCRQPTVPTTVVPQVSPIAWQIWSPGQTTVPPALGPSNTPDPIGVAIAGRWVLAESKKLGRHFDEQRGRQRNRPT